MKIGNDKEEIGTTPVKSFPPNPWGLYDMHGNVGEWCKDAWRGDYGQTPNDGGAMESLNTTVGQHVVRGGSWVSLAGHCRSACRGFNPTDNLGDDIGFRIVLAQPRDKYNNIQWGSAVDMDEYGMWKEFTVKGKDGQAVTQRMRWIELGTFLMGSPETEAGRYDNEDQHEVTFKDGFWMADTPVTQAMWHAAMGTNPSHFEGTGLPVETISWNDAQRFIRELNQIIPGLEIGLPTETQWEYACRAGTTTAFSFGDSITREQANQRGGYIPTTIQVTDASETMGETSVKSSWEGLTKKRTVGEYAGKIIVSEDFDAPLDFESSDEYDGDDNFTMGAGQ